MNQRTKTVLYTAAVCACVISTASAVILMLNAKMKSPEPVVQAEPAQDEPAKENTRQERMERRRNRGRTGDIAQIMPRQNEGKMPTREEFEKELIKGLDEYRALSEEERMRRNQEMQQVSMLVQSGMEMMRQNLSQVSAEELDRMRTEFDRFANAMNETVFSCVIEQHLTAEEDATIGSFVRNMRDAQDEVQMMLYGG